MIVVCLGAVATAVGAACFDKLPSPIGDNAEFAVLARAVASGHGLRYVNHPDLLAATKYPPGFPLMLAMWIPLFGGSMLVMKVVVFVCYVALVPATYLLARRFLGAGLSVVASLLVATSGAVTFAPIGILPYSHEVLSDVPFALFGLVGLLLLMNARAGTRTILAGLAVVMWAYLVRSAGASLVLAAALFLLVNSRKREAAMLLTAFAAFTALWALRNHSAAGEGSRYIGVLLAKNPYDPDLGTVGPIDLLRRAWINLDAYIEGYLPENILPLLAGHAGPRALRAAVSIAVMAVMGLGGYGLRKKAGLINIYLAFYGAVYLAWPEVWRSGRFMVPVAPIAAVYFLAGLRRITGRFRLGEFGTVAVAGVIAATNLYPLSQYASRPRGYSPGWANYFTVASWAGKNTDRDAVFLCRSTYLFYIFSGRRTIQYPFTRDQQAMRDYLAESRPDYIVVDNELGFPQTQQYLVPVLLTMQDALEQVYETREPPTVVLKFSPPDEGEVK
ncbi:MAG: glycosyltransferase family 39 protein [bacterium]